jgi:hypothetical protein
MGMAKEDTTQDAAEVFIGGSSIKKKKYRWDGE